MHLIRLFKPIFIFSLLFVGCTHPLTMQQQLQKNFSSHLRRIDTTMVLDSFTISRVDTFVDRMGRIIDDTIYNREMIKVKHQLGNALENQKKDSIQFYQDEVDYMSPQIDSVTRAIAKGDTTKKLGFLAECYFRIKKNNLSNAGLVYYFLDNGMIVRNSDMIDSFITRSSSVLR